MEPRQLSGSKGAKKCSEPLAYWTTAASHLDLAKPAIPLPAPNEAFNLAHLGR